MGWNTQHYWGYMNLNQLRGVELSLECVADLCNLLPGKIVVYLESRSGICDPTEFRFTSFIAVD